MDTEDFKKSFEEIEDFRQPWKVKHKLIDILFIGIFNEKSRQKKGNFLRKIFSVVSCSSYNDFCVFNYGLSAEYWQAYIYFGLYYCNNLKCCYFFVKRIYACEKQKNKNSVVRRGISKYNITGKAFAAFYFKIYSYYFNI